MGTSRPYDSPLRREGAARTREAIVAAGCAIVHELSSWDWRQLTIRAVAARAGVHERTVYRHFPTEQVLRQAVLQQLEEEAGVTVEGLDLVELPEHVSQLFHYLESFSSSSEPPMDESLAAVDQRRRETVLAAVSKAAPKWSAQDQRLAAAMIDVLWGVPSYRRLVSAWGLETDEATKGVSWLIALVSAALEEGPAPS